MRKEFFAQVSSVMSWVLAAFVVFYLTKTDIYLMWTRRLPAHATLLFALFLGVGALICLAGLLSGSDAPQSLRQLFPAMLPFAALAAVSLVSALLWPGAAPAGSHIQFLPLKDFVVFEAALLVGALAPGFEWWRTAVLGSFTVMCVTIYVDLFHAHTFTLPDLVGASGLAQNPNIAAMVVVVLMAAALDWRGPSYAGRDIVLQVLAVSLVVLTASRSGIAIGIVVALSYLVRSRRKGRSLLVTAGIAAIVAGSLAAAAWASHKPTVRDYFQSEQPKLADLFRIDSDVLRLKDPASDVRKQAVVISWKLIRQRPLFGWGTGATYVMPVGPHNIYLARWVDNGVIGLLLYLWFLFGVIRVNVRISNRTGVMVAAVFVLFGLVNHNVLDDRTLLLALGVSTAVGLRLMAPSLTPEPERAPG